MSKSIRLGFDYFGASEDRPLMWASKDGDFLASAGLESYYADKYENMLHKLKEPHSIDRLLGFAHEHNAKVMMRIVTPEDGKEIAFPFMNFTEIYTEPRKAMDVFKRAIEQYAKSVGYRLNVDTDYKNPETAFGKALSVKDMSRRQKKSGTRLRA